MHKSPALIAAAAVFLASVVPGAALPQDKDAPLQYESNVTLKLLQVYVTGKKGAPVTDLSAVDFEILDNGTIFPVTHFEKHFIEMERARPVPAAAVPTAAKPLGRKFFLVFDLILTDARGIVKAKNAALKFLDGGILPTDEIGVVSYSLNRGLVIHEYLTTEHGRVRAVVDGFAARPTAGRAENLTRFLFDSPVSTIPSAQDRDQSVPDPENQFYESMAAMQGRVQAGRGLGSAERQNYVDQAQGLIVALGQLAKVLRYIPGFKNIILFSGGIASQYIYGKEGGGSSFGGWTTPDQLASQLSKYDSARGDALLRDEHLKMLKEFKASNCPIYSVDVARGRNEGDVAFQVGVSNSAIREMEGVNSLRQFAGETGGKFYAKTMEPENIVADIQKTTAGYYVLGYSVAETWDEAFHRVKVKVNRPGVDVRTQGGYYDPKPFNKYSRFEKLLHVVDLSLSESPQMAEGVANMPVVALPLTVKGAPHVIAFARISRNAQADLLEKKSEAYVLLMNENGDMTATRSFELKIPDDARGTIFPSFLLPASPGSYVGRIILRNAETGRAARGVSPVVVPERSTAGLSLDPPLFLIPEKDATGLPASPGETPADFYGYDPNQYAPFVGDVSARTAVLQAALRAPGGSEGLEIKAFLLAPEAAAPAEVPVRILERSADGKTWVYLAEIATGELSAGRFTLRFEARDPKTEATASSSAVFFVK